MNSKKVYVVNMHEQDMSAAQRFGYLVPLVEGKQVNIFNIEALLMEIKPKLEDAEECDFILLSGNAVLNIIVTGIMLLKFGSINVLIFDARTRDYQPRTITERQL